MVLNLQDQQEEIIKDELTGFFRRDKLKEVSKDLYTVAMLDINGLKHINDTYGHDSGDKYILSVCNDIKAHIRKNSDIIIRQGGDEFLVVFDNCSIEEAEEICKRFKNVSYGIGQNKNINEAIKQADKKMYINKRNYYKSLVA